MKINAANRLQSTDVLQNIPCIYGHLAVASNSAVPIDAEIKKLPGYANVIQAFASLTETCIAFYKENGMPDDYPAMQGYRKNLDFFQSELDEIAKGGTPTVTC
ncbi:hypothetical protein [Burkholderia gladioli]|uniref:hypothetical protein n=1 Tax=Burkholderia gladioli TaxID=28095 RepID=UPI001640267F|nr:hypothetical protein [Burkholderia gladioli]